MNSTSGWKALFATAFVVFFAGAIMAQEYALQEYMPQKVTFYTPSDQGYERRISFFLRHLERLGREYKERPQTPSAGREKPPRQG